METNTFSQEKKDEYSLQVVNPTVVLEFKPLSPAKRLKDLQNKKIGLYWNHKAHGDSALNRVKELLSERFQGMSFDWFESGHTEKPTIEWFENIKKSGVDGVVATTGD
jgi:hypothetical protein